MTGELSSLEIEEVIKEQVLGRIGCHSDGVTYIVPVSYAYDGQYIFVRTKEGKKLDMMRKNPAVCFQTDIMKSMANWKSVVAWGTFEELKEKAQREEALHCLLNRILPLVSSQTTHISPQWPFPPENLQDIEGIVFRIRLTEKTGRFENDHFI